MTSKVITAALNGACCNLISVEVNISHGLPSFNIVGLADTSVKESKERVKAAIENSGYEFPISKITVNLSPADMKKEGSSFDLPIAIAILAATEQINNDSLKGYIILGELSLFGEINKIRGALPIALEALENNYFNFIIPISNANECAMLDKINVYPFSHLKEVIHFICYKDLLPYKIDKSTIYSSKEKGKDFSEIAGQESSKRALEIAAAGSHNIIMSGPPGCGKTMLAERFPSIIPNLNYEESLEVTKIYSIAGKLGKNGSLITKRPFRNPHSTSSQAALTGGGTHLTPGEISLAHNGILFLDEILEFKKEVLEALRQPLEDKKITISRFSGTATYSSNFILLGTLNPCPCGFLGSEKPCRCSDYEIKRYLNKLSGPLLDRIDIFTFVPSLSYSEIKNNKTSESSDTIKERVYKAREIQRKRFINEGIYNNSQMKRIHLKKYCNLNNEASNILEKIYDRFNLSVRSYGRILKVARTIADLNNNNKIQKEDIIEALQYRKFVDTDVI
ncbi:YifB family Mg chelatase-like AAA ATPase [Clostridium sporogenes]|uniref:ATP-binding protein n=1 Tax=Clostridium botulinum TaxID=1491 RepID=A0A6M0SUY4_CLOBO|nr:YifB family Mg chelatase-like AAA ATPase [Clostridium sporogenes]NFA59327.1 ATP-binding protein [Clostridium botulinum]NFI72731.1 ATP-binding protein [Clostridium sporogenes]NFL73789.1 ATP-binding protein [Clostridium sporogenes]NFM23495.1 ATP-binding protein [Clostridium sporogenes]NFP60144.1 ATP-binding protein [Clostridium sporogenes]